MNTKLKIFKAISSCIICFALCTVLLPAPPTPLADSENNIIAITPLNLFDESGED